jgi:hypothetical protein
MAWSGMTNHLEIGQPNNSEKCSETAEGVARESEGRSRLSFLADVGLGGEPPDDLYSGMRHREQGGRP